jgi:7-carboxy-7-deazaguanine synthase
MTTSTLQNATEKETLSRDEKPILISEIFGPTIQGEGVLIGAPTVFVRTGGCDFRCAWCDTLYAVMPEHSGDWSPMSAQEILARVLALTGGKPILLTLSGGNPALAPLEPLIELGKSQGFSFSMETQGSIAREWFSQLDYLVLSPKPPSSGMQTRWEKVARCVQAAHNPDGKSAQVSLKIVVFDEDDYLFAREAAAMFPQLPVTLQPGTPQREESEGASTRELLNAHIAAHVEWLIECVARDGWREARIVPQTHVLLWGNVRGV